MVFVVEKNIPFKKMYIYVICIFMPSAFQNYSNNNKIMFVVEKKFRLISHQCYNVKIALTVHCFLHTYYNIPTIGTYTCSMLDTPYI